MANHGEKMMKGAIALAAVVALSLGSGPALAAEGARDASLDRLLELVREGQARDAQEQQQRVNEFREQRQRQEQILRERRAERERLEQRSAELEQRFQQNELRIGDRQGQLDERLGSLKELFGVLQQISGDVKGIFSGSLVSTQHTGRIAAIDQLITKAGSGSDLPTIEEIEGLWFEMQREMVETGRVASYTAAVVGTDGQTSETSVVRVGAFNALHDDAYLYFDPEISKLVELEQQPSRRYLSVAEDYVSAAGDSGRSDLWVDPSRGSLLSVLVQTPDLSERIDQGGVVGYIIIALGLFALLLAAERFVVLTLVSTKVGRQMKTSDPDEDNPLGRVMITYRKHQQVDHETLELRLTETLVQETPQLTKGLALLKIIAVVAPLLGLLGTVTGMINTFQAIQLFGTGDPKLMAGGISQALVTTVLGLAVAIPTVLMHTVVHGRAKRLIQILEERSVGIVAEHQEREASHGSAG